MNARPHQHVALEVHQPEMAPRSDVGVFVDARLRTGEQRAEFDRRRVVTVRERPRAYMPSAVFRAVDAEARRSCLARSGS